MHRPEMNENLFQKAFMANNQFQKVQKRVYHSAAVDQSDAAKRSRFDSSDQPNHSEKRSSIGEETYTTMEVTNERSGRFEDNGDMDMDVDSTSEQPSAQVAHGQQQQQQQPQQLQQQQQQQQKQQQANHNFFQLQLQQQQQRQEREQQQQPPVRRRASLSTQTYQGQNNDFYTMGHPYIDLNSDFVAQKFDANKPTKIADEFPETIDDVEYMYQTTHGGDFIRHLMNSYPGDEL